MINVILLELGSYFFVAHTYSPHRRKVKSSQQSVQTLQFPNDKLTSLLCLSLPIIDWTFNFNLNTYIKQIIVRSPVSAYLAAKPYA